MKIFQSLIFIILASIIFFTYRAFYKKPAFMVGEKIPDFYAKTIAGDRFQMSEMEGKLTLLDFWGSWCGPCRKLNPQISKLYKKYYDTLQGNFQIVSIAFDDDTLAFKNALIKDSLVWPHHIREDKIGSGEVSKLFKIKEIPTTYLLNEQLKIIRVNPSVEELDKILQKILLASQPKSKVSK